MIGQMNILDYLDQQEVNYIKSLARCLKKWDRIWQFGYLEKLKQDSTLDMLHKTFLNMKTHFFKLNGNVYDSDGEDIYGAKIDKKENVLRIYKCGKEPDKIIATEPIEKLLSELVQGQL